MGFVLSMSFHDAESIKVPESTDVMIGKVHNLRISTSRQYLESDLGTCLAGNDRELDLMN